MKRSWLLDQIKADLLAEQEALPEFLDEDEDEDEDAECVDVRLQMVPTELKNDLGAPMYYWHLHYGDPCYDTDHTGFWGADVITSCRDARDIAEDLVYQCEEHAAQAGEQLTFEE